MKAYLLKFLNIHNNQASFYTHLLIFILAFVLLITRRPDAIFNPQFWAEDGSIFYAQAYNNGIIKSLFSPFAGYLNIVPRLTAAFSTILPLKAAPLLFNLIAIIIQILPVNFLISSRFSKIMPNLNHRIGLSFVYLALPGCSEIHANITNAQWHTALLMFMVIITQSCKTLVNLFDLIVVLLGGLTGPFSIILIPSILFFQYFKNKTKSINGIKNLFYPKFLILTVTALIQMFVIITDNRGQERLGKIDGNNINILSFDFIFTFSKILTNQLFLISLLGNKFTDYIVKILPENLYIILIFIVVIIGMSTLIYLLIKTPIELKSFIIFAALIPVTILVSEFHSIDVFAFVGTAGRYWFNLILGFVVGIIWLCNFFIQKKIFSFTKRNINYIVSNLHGNN
ncbi:hypothetical protein ACX27_13440 [Nostoc piscinale CENA21]|uniref:DUF2029 domain-containing protein n=1 Tax=Nostoc piscinale CENA21 TaxID=224013 RepID=A0A0M4TWM6_9NOSO|nr:hypothetical protein [Nostoc piscinale]ALF53614.1 hypothetical protein ACX27_13440 [Nostoc piscinale CENA21]